MMRCYFFHKWSRWSEPYVIVPGGTIRRQLRKCLKCNRVEESYTSG